MAGPCAGALYFRCVLVCRNNYSFLRAGKQNAESAPVKEIWRTTCVRQVGGRKTTVVLSSLQDSDGNSTMAG